MSPARFGRVGHHPVPQRGGVDRRDARVGRHPARRHLRGDRRRRRIDGRQRPRGRVDRRACSPDCPPGAAGRGRGAQRWNGGRSRHLLSVPRRRRRALGRRRAGAPDGAARERRGRGLQRLGTVGAADGRHVRRRTLRDPKARRAAGGRAASRCVVAAGRAAISPRTLSDRHPAVADGFACDPGRSFPARRRADRRPVRSRDGRWSQVSRAWRGVAVPARSRARSRSTVFAMPRSSTIAGAAEDGLDDERRRALLAVYSLRARAALSVGSRALRRRGRSACRRSSRNSVRPARPGCARCRASSAIRPPSRLRSGGARSRAPWAPGHE